MKPILFSIIGGGWRAESFVRIARALPEWFEVAGVLIRNPSKRADFERKWGVKTAGTLDELPVVSSASRFVIVCVPAAVAPDCMFECAARGVPVLCETPPALDLAGLIRLHALTEQGARVQVAEQYSFQPLHAAWLRIAESGRLGEVSQVQVSIAHGYHGIHLMRRFLGVEFQKATIEARPFFAPLIEGPGRGGPPPRENTVKDEQMHARFDFEHGKLGLFDFTGAQYFSWIRANRILVRGERGELDTAQVRWLQDFRTPLSAPLQRHDAGHGGNLEGFHHKGYTLGAEWVYQNPFAPGRLSDDEIAMADCLRRMADYCEGGPSFSDLRQASQDQYLSLLLQQAASTGRPVVSEHQPWM